MITKSNSTAHSAALVLKLTFLCCFLTGRNTWSHSCHPILWSRQRVLWLTVPIHLGSSQGLLMALVLFYPSLGPTSNLWAPRVLPMQQRWVNGIKAGCLKELSSLFWARDTLLLLGSLYIKWVRTLFRNVMFFVILTCSVTSRTEQKLFTKGQYYVAPNWKNVVGWKALIIDDATQWCSGKREFLPLYS